ncbi:MAG: type I DNA topoisomerase [Clostridia bacterium]|nr:type I DNA topoisomerase [Clostridia bacterium]
MSEYLVIVESPAKAKTIGRFLGKKYKVEASAGHLRDLPVSKMAIDIENNFAPQYMNIRGKGDLIKSLKKEAKEASKVFLATDPDREGEAISWHLAQILGIDEKSICRVTFNEITKNAVTEAFKSPRAIDAELVDAYQARRVLDRLVGYSISPVLWKKVKKGLSAGRVQSVATRLVCDREDEIEAFIPQEYWTISVDLRKNTGKEKISKADCFVAKYYGENGKKNQIKDKDSADKIYNDILNKDFIVSSVKRTEKKRSPAPPFITSTLQQEASRKLGFSASKTMSVVQGLYEGVNVGKGGPTGLVTYIRTDSTRISDEAAAAAKAHILSEFGSDFLPNHKRIYKNKNAAQDAHEAIRPSHIEYKPADIKDKLTNDQYKLYKLIYDRFIASQMADAVYDVCTVDFDVVGHTFRSVGSTVKFAGFTKLYEESFDEKTESDNGKLPALEAKERVIVDNIKPEQHFTQPPQRYTEASLVKALEENGIGRPSTYAPTISVILARGYIGKEKKSLYPTELGRVVNDLMKSSFSDIVDIEFTAQMEENLDKIEQGNRQWVDVVSEFYGDFSKEVDKATKELEHVKLSDPESDVPCDKCGRMMVIKTGKFGKFLACPGYPECKNTKPIIEEVGADCPTCGQKLIYRKTKTGKKYVACSNYPDCKFSSWNIPTNDKCPKCGEYIEIAQGKRGKYLKCSNKECDYISFFKKKKS